MLAETMNKRTVTPRIEAMKVTSGGANAAMSPRPAAKLAAV
jgi:hypothetical protein